MYKSEDIFGILNLKLKYLVALNDVEILTHCLKCSSSALFSTLFGLNIKFISDINYQHTFFNVKNYICNFIDYIEMNTFHCIRSMQIRKR